MPAASFAGVNAPHAVATGAWSDIAAYPTVHPVVDRFRAVGTSRPVDLHDPGDRDFALAVIDAWAADVGEDALPRGIAELRTALRDEAG